MQVSAIGRGRHTTRNVTLLEVSGGLLADTPGFNQPSLEGLPAAELPELFPEIQERLGRWLPGGWRLLQLQIRQLCSVQPQCCQLLWHKGRALTQSWLQLRLQELQPPERARLRHTSRLGASPLVSPAVSCACCRCCSTLQPSLTCSCPCCAHNQACIASLSPGRLAEVDEPGAAGTCSCERSCRRGRT